MIRKTAAVFGLILLLVAPSLFSQNTAVGKVVSFSGTVLIDAFGKGAFITPLQGDVLYSTTVIKTGADGNAVLDLQGKRQQLAPGATVKIRDLLASGTKKGALGWFQALGNLFKSFSEASQKKEDEVVLGSRAANVAEQQGGNEVEWEVEETDAAKILPDVRAHIEKQSYNEALADLARVDSPSDPALAWEVSFWKGFAFYQTEDYGDAAANLSAAWQTMQTVESPPGNPRLRQILRFQLGASWFLLGQEKSSIPLFEAYLAEGPADEYEPYAYLFLAKALNATGDSKRAKSVAGDAAKKYKGTDIAGEFDSLLK